MTPQPHDFNIITIMSFLESGNVKIPAFQLRREWIGIDITHLAISLIEKRLKDAFPGIQYEVHGTPKDLDGARDLAMRDKYQFQCIDGLIYFKPEGKTTEKAIVSVKGGGSVNVAMVRDLAHVVDREKAKIGVFITLADSTGPMRTEAVKAGFYETLYGKYPRIQMAHHPRVVRRQDAGYPAGGHLRVQEGPEGIAG